METDSELTDEEFYTLRDMLKSGKPLFGGCFELTTMRARYPRGFPNMERLCNRGLAQRAHEGDRPVGYVLTAKGRAVAYALDPVREHPPVCPTCHRSL